MPALLELLYLRIYASAPSGALVPFGGSTSSVRGLAVPATPCNDIRMLHIGLSNDSQDDTYRRALTIAGRTTVGDPNISVFGYDAIDPATFLRNCQLLVCTGGPDVAPERYKREDARANQSLHIYVDQARDDAEWALLNEATARGLPILAICRGCQLVNVFHGGTLIPDLEEARYSPHRRHDDGTERYHEVRLALGSRIARIAGRPTGRVNSSHHQAVERLAPPFTAVAWSSDDGVIEAYEWAEPTGKPPLLAVQWHPERMATAIPENPLGLELLTAFLREVAAL